MKTYSAPSIVTNNVVSETNGRLSITPDNAAQTKKTPVAGNIGFNL